MSPINWYSLKRSIYSEHTTSAIMHAKTLYSTYLAECLYQINQASLAQGGERYTQKQLAIDADVPQPTVSRILSGESKQPERGNYDRLVNATRLRLDEYKLSVGASPYTASEGVGESTAQFQQLAFELSQGRMLRVLEMLDEDVPGWTELPRSSCARLILTYYDAAK